jgi:hypothetical protein
MKKLFMLLAALGFVVLITETAWFSGLTMCNEGGSGHGVYLGIHSCEWAVIFFAIKVALLIASIRAFLQVGASNVWIMIKRQKLWLGAFFLFVLLGGGVLYWNELQQDHQNQVNYQKRTEVNSAVRSALDPSLKKYYLETVTMEHNATIYFMADAPVNDSVLGPAISALQQRGYSHVDWSVRTAN